MENILIGAKDIIEETGISDSTVRIILRKFFQGERIENTGKMKNCLTENIN